MFEDDKELWEERCQLNINIALHTQINCLEVIFYEHCAGVEYPRVYLDYTGLKSKIDVQEFNKLLLDAKAENTRIQRRVALRTVEVEVLNQMLIDYIMKGLRIKTKPGTVGLLNLSLFGTSIETSGSGSMPHRIDRPMGLNPVYIQRPQLHT